jgi:hypothetical protein
MSTNERGPSLVGQFSRACRAGIRDFCSALAALVGPVQKKFFLAVHYFIFPRRTLLHFPIAQDNEKPSEH